MSKRARRILLLNGFGNNIGDQAIFSGFVRVFGDAADAAGVDVTMDQTFIYSFPFRESTIETVNQGYDLVVFGGGGFIYHREHDQTASGWGFDIPERLIRTLTTPFAIYATGYNYRAYAQTHFPERTASHMRETVARAAHFSVREHGSIAMIEEQFGVRDPMSFVPDAALHVEPSRVHLPQLQADKTPVALCLRLDKAQERFPPPFRENFEHFVQTLVESLRRLIVEDNCQIVFTPHLLTRPDIEIGQLLKASLPPGSVVLLHEAIPSIYAGADLEYPGVLAGVYQRMQVVLGQRLHSLIMPFAVGTPVVSMTSTASSAWMQEEFGMPAEMHLDLMEVERDVTVDRFVGALRGALANRAELSERAFVRRNELVAIARRETRTLIEETLVQRAAPGVAAERAAVAS